VRLRQLLWTVVFLADRGADERSRLGGAVTVAVIVAAGWLLLRRVC
jgi:hypothetical protein